MCVHGRLPGGGYSDGNDSLESDGADTLLGVNSGVRPIFSNTPVPFPGTNPSPAFTDTIDYELSFQGFPALSALTI